MVKIKERQRGLLIIVILFLFAAASGMFVAGVRNAFMSFFGMLGALMFISVFMAKHEMGITGDGLSARGYPHRNWQNTALLLSICCTGSLGWLGLRREPLPLLDLGTSALVTALFSLISIGLVWYLFRLSLLSFPVLFLGVTFMYTSSPLILYQVEGLDAFDSWYLVNLESTMRGMPLVMLAFSSFLGGALLAAITNPKRYPGKVDNISRTSSGTLWKTGFILYLIFITVIAIFTLHGNALSLIYEGGYRPLNIARAAGKVGGLMDHTLTRFLPWSLLILTAASKDRRSYTHTLLLAIPACGIMFLMGDRSGLLTTILLMASGSYLLGFSIDWKRSLALFALVAFLVPTIVNLRTIPIKAWSVDTLTKAATNQVEDKPEFGRSSMLATLTSMSSSYQTLMGTITLVPDTEPHRYGVDYLRPLTVILPYSHTLFSSFGIDIGETPSAWFKARYSPYKINGLGYLQIAEAYLQFGACGVIGLYVILGVVLMRLWWHLHYKNVDSCNLALALIVMMQVIVWIRNDFGGVVRSFIWAWFFVYGLSAVLGGLQRLRTRIEDKPQIVARHHP